MSFTEIYSMIKIIEYIKNKSSPRTEPCDKPYFAQVLLDTWLLMETNIFVSKR